MRLGEPAASRRCHDLHPTNVEQELPPLLSLDPHDDTQEQETRRSRRGRVFLLSAGSRRPRASFPSLPPLRRISGAAKRGGRSHCLSPSSSSSSPLRPKITVTGAREARRKAYRSQRRGGRQRLMLPSGSSPTGADGLAGAHLAPPPSFPARRCPSSPLLDFASAVGDEKFCVGDATKECLSHFALRCWSQSKPCASIYS